MRANELKSLERRDLDVVGCGLILNSAWTKNRKAGFQPLLQTRVLKLKDWADKETARKCYHIYTRKSDHKPPDDPLLYVPSHPGRELEEDLVAAGIPKWTDDGKVDFHACRVAYITLLFEGGADVKAVQTLARHCDPRITMNVYAKARRETLSKVTEELGQWLLNPSTSEAAEEVSAAEAEVPAG